MNFLNKFRSFPEITELSSTLECHQKTDEELKDQIQYLVGLERTNWIKAAPDNLYQELDNIRSTDFKLLHLQVNYMNKTKGAYKDINRLETEHAKLLEKRNYIIKLEKTKKEKEEKLNKLQIKIKSAVKDTKPYKKLESEMLGLINDVKAIEEKINIDKRLLKKSEVKYQQTTACILSTCYSKDIEVLSENASASAEAGLEIQEKVGAMKYIPPKEDTYINDQIKELEDLIQSEDLEKTQV